MTNADRIREMSNKELADLLDDVKDDYYNQYVSTYPNDYYDQYVPTYPNDYKEWMEWLRKECDEE